MSELTQGLRATVLSAIVLCIVASMVGAGAQDKGGLRIAVINPGRLIAEYKFAKAGREQLNKMQEDVKLTLQTWDRYHMLSPLDQDVLTRLVLKGAAAPNNLTKAETQQMEGLKEKHEKLLLQFNQILQPAGNAQAAPPSQLAQLQKVREDTVARIKDKQENAQKELQAKEEEFSVKIDADIRDTLSKVAREKRLNLVFSNQVLLFADTDITEDVLKQLNSLKQSNK